MSGQSAEPTTPKRWANLVVTRMADGEKPEWGVFTGAGMSKTMVAHFFDEDAAKTFAGACATLPEAGYPVPEREAVAAAQLEIERLRNRLDITSRALDLYLTGSLTEGIARAIIRTNRAALESAPTPTSPEPQP
jgi:hypothetical protein